MTGEALDKIYQDALRRLMTPLPTMRISAPTMDPQTARLIDLWERRRRAAQAGPALLPTITQFFAFALLCTGWIAMLIAVLFSRQMRETEARLRGMTTGTVIRQDGEAAGKRRMIAAEYRVGSQTYTARYRLTGASKESISEYTEGCIVDIRYDPEDPAFSVLAETMRIAEDYLWIWLVPLGLLLAGILLLVRPRL